MAFNWPEPTLTVSNRVGIGTDNPSQALEVTGNIAATGDIAGWRHSVQIVLQNSRSCC